MFNSIEWDMEIDERIDALVDLARETRDLSEIDVLEREMMSLEPSACKIIDFACAVGEVNAGRYEDILLHTKGLHASQRDLVRFAIEVPGANISRLQDALVGIFPLGTSFARFAVEVPGADVDALRRTLCDKHPSDVGTFITEVDGGDSMRCTRELIDLGDVRGLVAAAEWSGLLETSEIEPAILDSGDAEVIGRYARKVRGADTDACRRALVSLGAHTEARLLDSYLESEAAEEA